MAGAGQHIRAQSSEVGMLSSAVNRLLAWSSAEILN